MIPKKLINLTLGLLAAGAALLAPGTAQAASATWTGVLQDSDGAPWPEWNDSTNWTDSESNPTIPNGVGEVATFAGLTGRLDIVLSDGAAGAGAVTLGGLDLQGGARIDMRVGVNYGTFTWDNDELNAFINSTNNDELLLQHNHVLNSTLAVTKPNGQMRLSRVISGPGGLILSGNQEFVLGESATANTFEGGVTFMDTSRVDVRTAVSTGSGAFTFKSTSTTNSRVQARNNWGATALPNAFVIEASGNGWITEESNASPRNFSGNVSGAGALKLEPKNSLWNFTGIHTSFTGALIVQGDGTLDPAFGVNGLFGAAASITLANSTALHITAADAIADTTVVTMDSGSVLVVGTGLNEVIGSGLLTVNGVIIPDGFYNSGSSWIHGDGMVTVGAGGLSSLNDILVFGSSDYPATISGTNITWSVPAGTNLATLAPEYIASVNATGSPASGVAPDFATTNPQTYTITSEDGNPKDYTVTVTTFVPTGIINMSIERLGGMSNASLLDGPAGGLATHWTQVTTNTASALRDSAGAVTTTSFSATTDGLDQWGSPSLQMLWSGLRKFATGSTIQLVIDGLAPDAVYDVWIASANVNSGQRSKGDWTTPNTTSTPGIHSVDNTTELIVTTWAEGNNYVLFQNVVVDANGKIILDGDAADTYRLPINGFQLVPAVSVPSGYEVWKNTYAGGQAADLDFNNDGVANGVAYFMGATGIATNPGLVDGVVTWPHSAEATDAAYRVLTSENLVDWSDVTADAIDADGFLTYTPPSTTPKLFVRLEVVIP